jgi:NAD(P)-dependent dehydrogenase (short-subunit alcohol dehydrogenase family)
MGLEQPTLWGGQVDASGATTPLQVARALMLEDEPERALRGDAVFVPRVRAGDRSAGQWRPPAGTALVSGGLGGVGRTVARWLAKNGVAQLVLTSRRGLATSGASELTRELERDGVVVHIGAVDVSDRDAMARFVATLPDEMSITSVFHVAGTSQRTALLSLTSQQLADVMAAKAAGVRVLEQVTATHPVSAFVCFGSIAGAWGAGQQAAYAAANAYLSGWSHERRRRGRHAVTVCWGPWVGAGMVDAPIEQELARRGLCRTCATRRRNGRAAKKCAVRCAMSSPALRQPGARRVWSPGWPVASPTRSACRPRLRSITSDRSSISAWTR